MAFLAAQEYKMFVSRHADRRIEASLHKKAPSNEPRLRILVSLVQDSGRDSRNGAYNR